MILLACSLGLVTWMYCRLYESDPGSPDSLASVPNQSAPCEQCHMTTPTIRVRHDYDTGAGW